MTISVQDFREALAKRGTGDFSVISPGVAVDQATGAVIPVDPSLPIGSSVAGGGGGGGGAVPSSSSGGGTSLAQDIASLTTALTPIAATGINLGLTLSGKKPAAAAVAPSAPWSTTKKVVVGAAVAIPVGFGLWKLLAPKRRGRRR